MSDLMSAFKQRKALITFITAGDPSLAITEKLIYDLEKAGADVIELGIPFSDPLADGPVIQASHQRALKKDTSLAQVFSLVKKVRRKTAIPICFMLSYNLIVRYGEEKFYQDCESRGVSGVVIPDYGSDGKGLNSKVVDRIGFIAPTTADERISGIVEQASGFIYLMAIAGITGKRQEFSGAIKEMIPKIRKYSKLPIAIGFGISLPAQAAAAAKLADGVIVGSAIVELIGKQQYSKALDLVAKMRRAIDAG
jgi:tryptophan synthase alpha chain